MANLYNQQPIFLDTDMASGWRSLQTLNVGTVPGYPGFSRQPGIRVFKIMLEAAGSVSAGIIQVVNPIDSTVLWNFGVATGPTQSGVLITSQNFEEKPLTWKDFKVTGLTATVTNMQIWYGV